MEQAGVIVPVNQATARISSCVIVESEDKKKKMHICLDPTPLNKAVLRELFYYHTPDDVYKLAKATCFTVIDFKKGYWQVPLDNESSYLTTFNAPFGCYWFTRLLFGITVSSDAFQRKLNAIYSNLTHTIGIADGMIVWEEKPDFSDHDKALDRFMQVTRQNNLHLSIDKIQYCNDQVEFFDTTYTTKGQKINQ